jgi:hypothetical protein
VSEETLYHKYRLTTVLTRLGNLDQWVAWKYGKRENGKQAKIPVDPRTGHKASTTDSGTWGSFVQASEAAAKYGCAGIGFVFTAEDGFMFVDLDNCIVDGEIAPLAMEIVEALDSYTEISPSGSGLKIFLEAKKPGERCRKGSVEIYDKNRFSTFTGQRFAGNGIEKRQEALCDLYRRLWPATPESTSEGLREALGASHGNLADDYELLEKARTAGADPAAFTRLHDRGYRDGEDRSAADNQHMSFLAFWTGKDPEQMERLFSAGALGQRDKWRSRKDYRQRTIAAAMARTTSTYGPKRPRETTREKLQQHMNYALFGHEWNTGRASAAATDYAAYRVLLEKAYKANTTTVDMSVRELCELAGIGSTATAVRSLRRLQDEHGLLTKFSASAKNKTKDKTLSPTYRLKPVDPKVIHILISTGVLSNTVTTYNTVNIRSMCFVLGQTLDLRNPAPDMPDFDRNGRKIPKGKPSPVDSLVKACGWILDMVSAAQTPLTLSFLSERTGVRPDHLKKRYTIPMTVAGLIRETEGGYATTANVEESLKDELEVSGCNERADLQRERHDREREAYMNRKNEKTDRAPTEEDMDAAIEDFSGIEERPILTPIQNLDEARVQTPDSERLRPLYRLLNRRIRTHRGYGRLWQVFSGQIGVVLESDPDIVTYLREDEVPHLQEVA